MKHKFQNILRRSAAVLPIDNDKASKQQNPNGSDTDSNSSDGSDYNHEGSRWRRS